MSKRNHFGKNNPMYGKKHSEEAIEKMRKAKLRKKNPNWNNIKNEKIADASYHRFIMKRKEKPLQCENCNDYNDVLELSFNHNLKNYTRNIEDYKWLCKSCHMKRDYNDFGVKRGFLS